MFLRSALNMFLRSALNIFLRSALNNNNKGGSIYFFAYVNKTVLDGCSLWLHISN